MTAAFRWLVDGAVALSILLGALNADSTARSAPVDPASVGQQQTPSAALDESAAAASALPVESAWTRLAREGEVWIDKAKRAVIVGGEVCHREGPLEMFACPRNTKEYESVVVVNCKAYHVHAGLLAVGAQSGKPVQFLPEYQPATGSTIDVFVRWRDAEGKIQEVKGQEWIQHAPSGKPMQFDWVFGGSGFWVDEQTGTKYYHADGSGDLICVSNFSTATLDVPVRSSQSNAELMFNAFTENIPPQGTKIQLKLVPRIEPATQKKPN